MNLIKKMGITSPTVLPYPSICLGVFNASVYDMVGAYSVFANHGIWTEPTFIVRIEDKKGNVLYTHKPRVSQAMNEQTAYVMTDMMKSVIEKGTGSRLRFTYHINNPVAGKTGTPQELGEGANMALPIFALFMQKVYANPELGIKKNVDFDPPKAPLTTTLGCDAYEQQEQGTNDVDKKLSF